jgi:putative tricarboxylic transport membrane protein
MKRPELALGIGTLLLGGLIAAGATQISSDAGYAGVGPNFLPLVVGALLMVCAVGLLREVFGGGFRDMEAPSGAEHGDWKGFAWVSVAILANAALITRIGFILSCTLCFVLAVRGFRWSQGRVDWSAPSWLVDALIGFAIAAPVFWMFTQLLGINLPGLTSTGWL